MLAILFVSLAIKIDIMPPNSVVGALLITLLYGVLGVCAIIILSTLHVEIAYARRVVHRWAASFNEGHDSMEREEQKEPFPDLEMTSLYSPGHRRLSRSAPDLGVRHRDSLGRRNTANGDGNATGVGGIAIGDLLDVLHREVSVGLGEQEEEQEQGQGQEKQRSQKAIRLSYAEILESAGPQASTPDSIACL